MCGRLLAGAARRTLGWQRSAAASAVRRRLFELGYDIHCEPGVKIGPGVRMLTTEGGHIHLGPRVRLGRNVSLIAEEGGIISIGEATFVGDGSAVVSYERVEVGDHALLAEYVTIRDQNHGTESDEPYGKQPMATSPIRIGDGAWIGAKATVVPGADIGARAIVGANSFVNRPVAEGERVGGVPARPIRAAGRPPIR